MANYHFLTHYSSNLGTTLINASNIDIAVKEWIKKAFELGKNFSTDYIEEILELEYEYKVTAGLIKNNKISAMEITFGNVILN